jgi:hypothetical protein
MCDYSLQDVQTRPAKVGDKLFTRRFSSGTTGFAAPDDINVAVCLLPVRLAKGRNDGNLNQLH